MSSSKHSASKPPSAKQALLEILAKPVLASASPKIFRYQLQLLLCLLTLLLSQRCLLSKSSLLIVTPIVTVVTAQSLVRPAPVQPKWFAHPDLYDKGLDMAVFLQDPASCDVICGIWFVQEVVKVKGQYVTEQAKLKLLLQITWKRTLIRKVAYSSVLVLHQGYLE